MDEATARAELGEAIQPDGSLYSLGWYLNWGSDGSGIAILDGPFTLDQLEAIAWWMRNRGVLGSTDGEA